MDARGDKRVGDPEIENGSCKKPRKGRFLELYRQLEDSDFHDAFILVHDAKTGEKIQLKVHKVMILAASEVLKTQFSPRWDPLKEPVIKLPEEYSVEAATAFIKLLYMDFVDTGVSLETVLQIASICDMYMIEDAMEISNDFVITKIEKDNCLLIHETYETIHVGNPSLVFKSALKTIAENIHGLITSPSAVESWSEANWRTVLNLESLPDLQLVEWEEPLEFLLFQQLLKWKEANLTSRETIFNEKLLPLVRFPLMTLETLAEEVVPTGVLSAEESLGLFCYHSQLTEAKSQGKCKPRFPQYSRTIKLATNSEELENLLISANPHDNILLSPGDFSLSSHLQLNQNKVKISGSGNLETRLVCNGLAISEDSFLTANTSDSLFTNLQFVCNCPGNDDEDEENEKPNIIFSVTGSRNVISKIESHSCLINITGNFNTLSSSTFENCERAVELNAAKENVVKDVRISASDFGLMLYSGLNNIIENVQFEKVGQGIYSRRSSNGEFRSIAFKFNDKEETTGIEISGGSYNKIIGLICSPIIPFEENENLMESTGIKLHGRGKGNEVTNFSGTSPKLGVKIRGKNVKNVVKNFKTCDTFVCLKITDSNGNMGETVVCEYSTRFLKSDLASVRAIKIQGGKNNNFKDVQIVTENDVLEKSGNAKEAILAFLKSPNLVKSGKENVVAFRNSSV